MQSKKDRIEVVKNFIFNDDAQSILLSINISILDFNILEITGMGTQEIKHSNVLSWIFADKEHGLGYSILDKFLKKVNLDFYDEGLQEYLYLPRNNRDIKIFREKNGIDILIVDKANKVVIAIENKVYAHERIDGKDDGQLKKYEDYVKNNYSNYLHFFIFLTIDGYDSSRENWLNASYTMIGESVIEILETETELSNKSRILFDSYLDLLTRRGIMANEKLEELCKKIWENDEYAEALNILQEYKTSEMESIFNEVVERLKKNNIEMHGDYIVLDGIVKLYEKLGAKNWEDEEEYLFDVFFKYYSSYDYIYLEYHHYQIPKTQNKKLLKFYKSITGKEKLQKTTKIREIRTISKEESRDKIVADIISTIENTNTNILNSI
jgi:hypothetical protein